MNEKIRSYFDRELVSTLAYTVFGIIAGYFSFIISQPLKAVVIAAVMMVVATLFIRFILRVKEKYGWYLKNGIMIFLLVWFIAWTVFFNSGMVI